MGIVFVVDSGNGKVVWIVDGLFEDVIVNFGLDVYGKGFMYDIGFLGLVFMDKDIIVVGGGSYLDGEEMFSVY